MVQEARMKIKGRMVRLHNRRVQLFGPHLDTYQLVFKKLNDIRQVEIHEVAISEEAFFALFKLMADEMSDKVCGRK